MLKNDVTGNVIVNSCISVILDVTSGLTTVAYPNHVTLVSSSGCAKAANTPAT